MQLFIYSKVIEFIDFVEMHLINQLGAGKENVHDLIDMETNKELVVTENDIIITDSEHKNDVFPKCKRVFHLAFVSGGTIDHDNYDELNEFVRNNR